MNRLARSRRRAVVTMVALAAVLIGVSAVPSQAAPEQGNNASDIGATHQRVCGAVPAHFARCHAVLVVRPSPSKRPTSSTSSSTSTTAATTTSTTGATTTSTTAVTTTSTTATTTTSTTAATTTTTTTAATTTTLPVGGCTAAHAGLTPCDLVSAYGLASATAGTGQTVAIVDAYDDPRAEADLAVYRSAYGLPACTTANGCFKKVNQNGVEGSYPVANTGWAQEISLDLDMVSAVCPNCHILLVEASSNSYANLGAAVDRAVTMGANVVSNSYGGGEFSTETSLAYEGHYNHPGVAITVSSGDSGYGVEFPAASQYVTAVGGTSLRPSASSPRGWSETVWSGAGSGCSAYVPKPAWQHDTGCARRTVADVSAVADPYTGVAVYDSYNSSGWLVFGGTSVAAPIVGAVYALAGNAGSVNYGSFPYGNAAALNDVTSGSNGSCSGSYLCTGVPGYDGPTGLGTPNGFTGF